MKKRFSTFIFPAVLLAVVMLMVSAISLTAQSINFKFGGFIPRMQSDLWEINLENLVMEKSDVIGPYYGLEYEAPLSRFFSLSLEGGHYEKTVYSYYREWEFNDGSPITQDFTLRIMSLEAGFKLYPAGRRGVFSPFLGAGAGLYSWRFYQGGNFVNHETGKIFEGEAETERITPGFNLKAGCVFRLRRLLGFSLEARYLFAKDNLSTFFEGFEKFDLSGLYLTAGIHIYFR